MAQRKTRQQISQEYGTQAPAIKPGQSEEAYFRMLAKRADQRLVRLERLAEQQNFEGVLSYAYKGAMKDIRQLTGNREATRFNVALQKTKSGDINKALLHAKINAVKRFLESPTSMKSTILESYKKRADTINRKYGTNLNWQQLGRFWESAGYQKMLKTYGSDVILKAIGQKQKSAKPDDIKKGAEQNVRVPEDAVVKEVEKAMTDSQLTLKDFGI